MVPDSRQLTVEQAIARAKKAVRAGDERQALQLYRAILQQQPNHAVAKKACRKLEKAMQRKHAAQAKAINPPQQLIDALIENYYEGEMHAVVDGCTQQLEKFPRSAVLINLQGAALQVLGRLSESIEAFDKAIALQPDFAEAHSNRGNALKDLGDTDEAIASYDRAIRLNPRNAVAYLNRGNACKDDGRLEIAAACYDQAIGIRPDFAEAHRNLSAVKTYQAGDTQIAAMEKLLVGSHTSESDRARFRFALAKAQEDLGDYDAAFQHFDSGNRIRKAELDYKLEDDVRLFARIKELFAESASADAGLSAEPANIRPVFIVGMMRSGTSLVEQILASHSGVYGAGELERFNQLVSDALAKESREDDAQVLSVEMVRRMRQGYVEKLASLNMAKAVVTDKMPANFRWIGFILSAFSEAKIVHVKRDPVATCWSVYKHYFPTDGNGYGYDLQDLAAYYNLYSDLMAFWQVRYPDRIYALSYEKLTESQEEESRRLLEFCELDWEEGVLKFHETQRPVRTQSAAQVRQAMYQGSSNAWRHYEKHLEPLIKGLE